MIQTCTNGFEVNNSKAALTAVEGITWGANGTVSTATGRFGGKAMALTTVYASTQGFETVNNPHMYIPMRTPVASGCFGFAFQLGSNKDGSNYALIAGALDTNGKYLFYLAVNASTGYLTIFVPQNATSAALSSPVSPGNWQIVDVVVKGSNWTPLVTATHFPIQFDATSWYYVEVKFVLGASGSLAVNINNTSVTELSYSGTMVPSGTGFSYNNLMGQVDLCASTLNGSGANGYTSGSSSQVVKFDDFYFADTSGSANNTGFLGPLSIVGLMPTSNVSVAMTPDSGSNYARVNEVNEDGDTSYVSAASTPLTDIYGFPTLSAAGTVFGVKHIVASKTTVGTGNSQPAVTIGGTTYNPGSPQTIGTTYGGQLTVIETQPSDSSQWTQAKVNAANFGVKFTSP